MVIFFTSFQMPFCMAEGYIAKRCLKYLRFSSVLYDEHFNSFPIAYTSKIEHICSATWSFLCPKIYFPRCSIRRVINSAGIPLKLVVSSRWHGNAESDLVKFKALSSFDKSAHHQTRTMVAYCEQMFTPTPKRLKA